ncbi:unnamed protein product, partial [Rodentolepis nana]|uniref:DET1- and DDB1-associated protein 1 n=1 Tax=Rodentolepis nana TaxID=102285 RepID=A0A0R3TVD3_RODNA
RRTREFKTSRCNELKARTQRNSGQWHSPTYPTSQESKPLLSLDYVPTDCLAKHLQRLGVYSQGATNLKLEQRRRGRGQCAAQSSTKEKQWTVAISDIRLAKNRSRGNGEDPPDVKPTGGNGEDPSDSLQEKMEKTHLIRCSSRGNGEDPPDSVSHSKDKDGKPEILGSN